MASFHTKIFTLNDDYMTPRYVWENIKQYIPKDQIIWEAFYGDGGSKNILNEMGFENVIHKPYPQYDFFNYEPEDYGLVLSNPPFSEVKYIMPRLKALDKPFILIMPCSKITCGYFRDFVKDIEPHSLQIIVPRSRIHFKKLVNGKISKEKSNANFDCYYYCYKMNLPTDIIFLGDDALKRDKPEWLPKLRIKLKGKYTIKT